METISALQAICAGNLSSFDVFWINGWVNDREAGDLIRYGAHYDASVMNISTNHCSNFQMLMINQPPRQQRIFFSHNYHNDTMII